MGAGDLDLLALADALHFSDEAAGAAPGGIGKDKPFGRIRPDLVDSQRGDFSRTPGPGHLDALDASSREWAWHATTYSQQDRLLQEFQRFQFVQATRACFTWQRPEQGIRYRFDTVKIVQAGHGSKGERYRVSLRYCGGGK
ncbi:hypothetical protein [Paraburkholderia oxyphila]|uniref:hypothetical protein n=1 Tax=Paraburkholderia oxyphila TaxID=614212 RepID=UPI0004817575